MVCDPAEFTVFTVPERFARKGDPHAEMDRAAGSLAALLEMAARDEAQGLGDAPWPPHFRKMEGEGKRVAPSRAKKAPEPKTGESEAKDDTPKRRQSKMPLIVIANSTKKDEALAGLERWKAKYPDAAKLLAVDEIGRAHV